MLRRRQGEDGYTLLELMVTTMVVGVLFAVGGGAFMSLSNTASRSEASVEAEQSANDAMTQLERDVRSAESISIPAATVASDGVQLDVLNADGSTTNVEWIYNPSARTVVRQVDTNSGYEATNYSMSSVSSAGFTYYGPNGDDISTTTTSNISTCTTAISVMVDITPTITGAAPFQESAELAVTNQLAELTAPGNGQCGQP